jgi:hypothetical protein
MDNIYTALGGRYVDATIGLAKNAADLINPSRTIEPMTVLDATEATPPPTKRPTRKPSAKPPSSRKRKPVPLDEEVKVSEVAPLVYPKADDPVPLPATPPAPPDVPTVTPAAPEQYDRTAFPKFRDGRLKETGPINSNDVMWSMGIKAVQQAVLMGGTAMLGSSLEPWLGHRLGAEAGMLMYHALGDMKRIYNANSDPTDLAAAEGLAVINDVLFDKGDIAEAYSRVKRLKRGSLESVAGVNDQVIAAFAKGLKTSNSLRQGQRESQAMFRSTFGGV